MPAPGSQVAEIGSTLSQMPNTAIRTTPVTNSGTADSERPLIVMPRSAALPSLRAAIVPPIRLSGTTIKKATRASSNEWRSAVVSWGRTGTCSFCDVPKSPWTTPVIQSLYCVSAGLSVPSWWLRDATAWGLASGPRIERPTLPGSSWMAQNTSTEISQRVITASPRRRSMKRAMVWDLRRRRAGGGDLGCEARLLELHVADGGDHDSRER